MPDMVMHAYNPNYSGGRGRKIMSLRPFWAKVARPCLKNKMQTKRAQVVEPMSSMQIIHTREKEFWVVGRGVAVLGRPNSNCKGPKREVSVCLIWGKARPMWQRQRPGALW
jgi:hypothetical protein